MNYIFSGSDSRFAIDTLTGDRYFVCSDNDSNAVPFGYVFKEKAGDYQIYQSDYSLPLAFVYSKTMPTSEYDSLTNVQKQEVLLQSCVLDEAEYSPSDVRCSSKRCDFAIVESEGVCFEDGAFMTSKKNASMTISFEGVEQAENYLCFKNFEYEYPGLGQVKMSLSGIKRAFFESRRASSSISAPIEGGRKKSLNLVTNESNGYGGRNSLSMNLGYFDNAQKTIEISFGAPGRYKYSDFWVECQPTAPLVDEAISLKSGDPVDLQLVENGMIASVASSEDGEYLYISFPYSSGWTATLDGAPVKVLKANQGFMAVPLESAGKHDVSLSYKTLGLRVGAVCTLVGAIAFVVLVMAHKRRKVE